jgi:hypothetical protein
LNSTAAAADPANAEEIHALSKEGILKCSDTLKQVFNHDKTGLFYNSLFSKSFHAMKTY